MQSDNEPTPDADDDPFRTVDENDDIQQTTPMDASGPGPSDEEVSVYRGSGTIDPNDPNQTVGAGPKETTVDIVPDSDQLTALEETSILASREIGATVNPRELSDDDVTAWSLAVGDSTEQSVLTKPADSTSSAGGTRETYAEERIRRLRRVDVAALQSNASAEFDYRLVRKLGQGGMGDVFVARQGSLDRLLAFKLIKPLSGKKREQLEKTGRLEEVEEERRQQFLSEAIVTGDLDHPNIVPIHDVGLTSDNHLFYAMKRVVGTPWSDVIKEKTQDENLEILLKAADAIAFAHARGVVHRDIKPENIMLGDFGVVMVMDWGLALLTSDYEKQDSIMTSSGLGGTPAFMAPEMATGPLSNIGKPADIYLLGATLFMIVTGKPPHFGRNVSQCLQAVRNNEIRQVPDHLQGELLDIALHAMADEPADRYQSVEEFQTAIRQYRARAESILLASRAADDLQRGREERSYAALSRAAFRFEEALKFWEGNEKARQGLAETKRVHAGAAYDNGDYDLGLSLLDDSNPEHRPVMERLRAGLAERESRLRRLSLLRKVAAAMLAFILIGGSVAMFVINRERRLAVQARDAEIKARAETERARVRAVVASEQAESAKILAELNAARAEAEKQEAEKQRAVADDQRAKAEQQRSIAVEQTAKALAAKQEAELARDQATTARAQALASRQRAVYEEYVSKIGLAKARLERNEADGAREILQTIREESPERADSWEWRWLWRQANESTSVQQTPAPITDLSLVPSGRSAAVSTAAGQVFRFAINAAGMISAPTPVRLSADSHAVSIALSPNEQTIAVGTNDGKVILIDSLSVSAHHPRVLTAHQAEITDLQFASDRWLVTGSRDRTVRWWNVDSGSELTEKDACWHLSPVRQLSVVTSESFLTVAVAVADDQNGRVVLWKLNPKGESATVRRIGTFTGHQSPVTAVAITGDGRQAASGDAAGNVFLWNTAETNDIDYTTSLRNAIAGIEASTTASHDHGIAVQRLVDSALETPRLVSANADPDRRGAGDQEIAHADAVRSIRFSPDGTQVLTAADDHTLKLWSTSEAALRTKLRGHGGWVVAAQFLPDESGLILSASNDQTLRTWAPATYVGSFVRHQSSRAASEPGTDRAEAHQQPITSVALSPDGTHVVTASADHTGRVMKIDPESLRFTEVARLEDEVLEEGSEFVAMSACLDTARRRLYVGSADATVRIWDLDRAVQLGEATRTGLNTSLAISGAGDLMLTGSSLPAAKALLWRLDPEGVSPPRVIHRLGRHQQAVTALAISPDSQTAFTGDRLGRGILWDVESGEPVGPPLDQLRGFRINAAQFSPDGNEILLAADDQQLTRIDVSDRDIVSRLTHDGAVLQVSMTTDGKQAVTLSEQASQGDVSTVATLWNLETGQEIRLDQAVKSARNQGARITSVNFDPAGKYVSVSRSAAADKPAIVRLWSLDQSTLVSAVARRNNRRRPALAAAAPHSAYRLPPILGNAESVLPIDAKAMLTLNKNGAFLWQLSDHRLIHSYRPHAALTQADFSFDGRRIATASRSVKLWDAETGRVVGKIESPHVGPVRSVDFAPVAFGETGYLLATGGDDGMARLWSWDDDSETFKELQQYDIESSVVRRVRFSDDGTNLLVVGDAGVARVWEPRTDKTMRFDKRDSGDFTCGAFSGDGQHIAVGSSDEKLRVWRLPNGGAPPGEPIRCSGHADTITDVELIGDGAGNLRVLSASADDTARLWDPRLTSESRMGRELLSLRRHEKDVTAVDATSDGELVVTAGRDGAVILWPAGR